MFDVSFPCLGWMAAHTTHRNEGASHLAAGPTGQPGQSAPRGRGRAPKGFLGEAGTPRKGASWGKGEAGTLGGDFPLFQKALPVVSLGVSGPQPVTPRRPRRGLTSPDCQSGPRGTSPHPSSRPKPPAPLTGPEETGRCHGLTYEGGETGDGGGGSATGTAASL